MRAKRKRTLVIIVSGMILCTLFSVAPAFSRGGPGHPATMPHPKSKNHNVPYQTVPLTMQMEAGAPFHLEDHPGGIATVHSGVGWMLPFGRASYVGGIGYPEAEKYKPDYMDDESWGAMFSTGLFCIYSFEDGDIYAFDGVMGNVQPALLPPGDDGKGDYLLNVIVGGTGRYRNANGILLGRTTGRGDAPDTTLPLTLLKTMEGYINIQVKKSMTYKMLPAVGTKNPQKWPDVVESLLEDGTLSPEDLIRPGELIPINIEMEAGRAQWDDWGSGTTIIAGTGWLAPFGRSDYHYGFGYDEDTDALRPDFMDDPSWTAPYPTSNLCIYHTQYGDIYAYDGIVGNLAPETDDGKADYLLEIIVGGTDCYEGATGVLLGYAFGRGEAVDDGYGGPFPLPDSIIKIMEGYLITPETDAEDGS